ncbi:hypothetical protein SprV_0100262400 [Sparganum proliferum]
MGMIFAARQLQEKCQEMQTHLYSTFVDLTKAFDTVNREGPWKIMQKFGCPKRFAQMVRQLHGGIMQRVTDNGAVSEAFAVTNGVKQGCLLAPTLFSLMFSAMLLDAHRGIQIAYRTDVQLINHPGMHFQSHVFTTAVHELLFADDCAPKTISEGDMQRSMDIVGTTAAVQSGDLDVLQEAGAENQSLSPQLSSTDIEAEVLTSLSTNTIYNRLFEKDCALNTVTVADMQRSVNIYPSGCDKFGLTISTDKTVVMHHPPPNAAHNVSCIYDNGIKLKNVDKFFYLGSILSRCIEIDDQVAQRIWE